MKFIKESFINNDMRLAFVVRLGPDSQPAEGSFEGWVEEVDSCIEKRFRSTEELLKFLGQCFDLATTPASNEAQADDGNQPRRGKKTPCRGKEPP